MFAPIYNLLNASTAVQALLGNPVRVYAFGEAPKDVIRPYLVYQTINGSPENYLGENPDFDSETFQFDVYASTGAQALQVAKAVRDQVQECAYVTGWRGDFKDPATDDSRVSFDVDWQTNRT
jgi:hypothetical protein